MSRTSRSLITGELLCGWFDDAYEPDDTYFCSCFTTAELSALAQFNIVLDESVKRLPKSNGTIKSWLGSSAWREVMRAASQTLAAAGRLRPSRFAGFPL